jgi:flavin-dependent dehydrogenase
LGSENHGTRVVSYFEKGESMENTKKKVLIVGGGSAGWMTAAYLSKVFDRQVSITLVESANIGTIGVGEATFSTIRLFFDFLGLEEEDWMPSCNASYKLAIKFVDWNSDRQHFYHPFQRYESVQGHNMAEWWLKLRGSEERFDYACFTVPALCDAQRSPRYMDGRIYDNKFQGYVVAEQSDRALQLAELKIQYPYGYHFDASLIAKFMAQYAKKRGVTEIIDDVDEAVLLESGDIAAIQTRRHGRLEADLFVDCTGFRGLLINKALGEPFIPFSESLLCNSAVALQVPSKPEIEGINPYTTATALSAGWVWNIPLFHRIGTGYVYSNDFISADEAEREFRQHLGPRAEGCTANHIKMRIGRSRNSWVKNCVAIGLSSGFVEPLESTGIFFIQHAIEELVNHFPGSTINPAIVKSYNKSIADCIDAIRDFLVLHYVASTREDTAFWKATKEKIQVPAGLADNLELWRRRLPTNRNINPKYHGFEAYSYSVMLLGLGLRPAENLPILDYSGNMMALKHFEKIKARSQQLVTTLPSAYEYLASRYDTQETNGEMRRQLHAAGG